MTTPEFGPVELLVVTFPGDTIPGAMVDSVRELVAANTVNLLDLVFARKDADGNVTWLEPESTPFAAELAAISASNHAEFLAAEDVEDLSDALDQNSIAAIILFENVWATRFGTELRRSGGKVVINDRIPGAVIAEVLQELHED